MPVDCMPGCIFLRIVVIEPKTVIRKTEPQFDKLPLAVRYPFIVFSIFQDVTWRTTGASLFVLLTQRSPICYGQFLLSLVLK